MEDWVNPFPLTLSFIYLLLNIKVEKFIKKKDKAPMEEKGEPNVTLSFKNKCTFITVLG
jgi:hypothetical protein